MLSLPVTHFIGYTTEDILEYLHIHQPNVVDVILPKLYDHTEPNLISIDYLRAAYVGQLLDALSEVVTYSIPSPDSRENFSLLVCMPQYEPLAAHLSFLAAAYAGDIDEEADLDCDAAAWFSCSENLEEVVCPAYLEILRDLDDW